jgi:hypothetical protein
VWPNAARDLDVSGKSSLHYAASTKNNERVFNLLVQAGADELATDRVKVDLILKLFVLIVSTLLLERTSSSFLQEE